MADVIFKKALEMAGKTWKEAMNTPSSTGKDAYEDGRYQAVIKGATLGLSQSSSRLQVAWTYEFLDGQYAGKTKMDWDGCDSLENQIWLGRKLAKLGYEVPEDISELEPILSEIVKSRKVLTISLKTKGEFQKVYIDRVSEEEAETETKEVSEPEVEEASLEIGMKVSFDFKGEKVEGEVLEILEKEEKVKVKTSAGKVYKLSPEALELIAEEEEEVVEESPVEEVEEETEIPEEPVKSKVVKKLPSKPVVKKKKR